MSMRKSYFIILCLLLRVTLAHAGGSVAPAVSARFQDQVEAIAAGANTPARATAITQRLDALGIEYRHDPFVSGNHRGTNIIAGLPGVGMPRLMLGAHYDRVAAGRGAVDNAAGAAVVLELLAAFQAKPLKNYTVTAAFFDLEELGLLGSQAYVAAQRRNLPAVFLNIDVFGYGNALWALAPKPASLTARAMRQAAAECKFPLEIGPIFPASDHLSFAKTGVDTLALSLLERREIERMKRYLNNQRPDETPRILTIIHSAHDTPDKVDRAAVLRALPVVEQAIRLMDKERGAANERTRKSQEKPATACGA